MDATRTAVSSELAKESPRARLKDDFSDCNLMIREGNATKNHSNRTNQEQIKVAQCCRGQWDSVREVQAPVREGSEEAITSARGVDDTDLRGTNAQTSVFLGQDSTRPA